MLVAGVQWGISRTLPVAVQCACVKGKVEIEGGIAAASLSLSLSALTAKGNRAEGKWGRWGRRGGKSGGRVLELETDKLHRIEDHLDCKVISSPVQRGEENMPRRDELLPALLLLILNWSDHFKLFQHLQDGDRLCDTSRDGEHHVSKSSLGFRV